MITPYVYTSIQAVQLMSYKKKENRED